MPPIHKKTQQKQKQNKQKKQKKNNHTYNKTNSRQYLSHKMYKNIYALSISTVFRE